MRAMALFMMALGILPISPPIRMARPEPEPIDEIAYDDLKHNLYPESMRRAYKPLPKKEPKRRGDWVEKRRAVKKRLRVLAWKARR